MSWTDDIKKKRKETERDEREHKRKHQQMVRERTQLHQRLNRTMKRLLDELGIAKYGKRSLLVKNYGVCRIAHSRDRGNPIGWRLITGSWEGDSFGYDIIIDWTDEGKFYLTARGDHFVDDFSESALQRFLLEVIEEPDSYELDYDYIGMW